VDTEKFVERVKWVVVDQAVEGVESTLRNPGGRKPDKDLVELSEWFGGLDDEGRRNMHRVIRLASHQAAFGFCCVLDGVRRVTDPDETGAFELFYVVEGRRLLLNDPEKEMLHDILNRS
jgi:hypothetical protein